MAALNHFMHIHEQKRVLSVVNCHAVVANFYYQLVVLLMFNTKISEKLNIN